MIPFPFILSQLCFNLMPDTDNSTEEIRRFVAQWLLEENRRTAVADFQRPYTWSESHVTAFTESLLDSLFHPETSAPDIGVVVIEKTSDTDLIVDGQQRLLTFALLIIEWYGEEILRAKKLGVKKDSRLSYLLQIPCAPEIRRIIRNVCQSHPKAQCALKGEKRNLLWSVSFSIEKKSEVPYSQMPEEFLKVGTPVNDPSGGNAQRSRKTEVKIISIEELFSKKLAIADYQRPYKWSERSVNLLLDDLKNIAQSEKNVPYRLGTVIVHRDEVRGVGNIIDGQQRIITLSLLLIALSEIVEPEIEQKKKGESERSENGSELMKAVCDSPIFKRTHSDEEYGYDFLPEGLSKGDFLQNSITKRTLRTNMKLIRNRVRSRMSGLKEDWRALLLKAFSDKIEVVFIEVPSLAQAFQIFDSQNGRGKKLAPHDLLKAYHLRCMRGELEDQREAVSKWENHSMYEIGDLFSKCLHRIYRWRLNKPATPFSEFDIDEFKGVDAESPYRYALRTLFTSSLGEIDASGTNHKKIIGPVFQIGEPFISGRDFFKMAEYYLELKKEVRNVLRGNLRRLAEKVCDDEYNSKYVRYLLENSDESINSIGFVHAFDLLLCGALYYCDRYGNSESISGMVRGTIGEQTEAFLRLFTWAMLIRTQRERLGFDSINKYALGQTVDCGCNENIFKIIAESYKHEDFLNLQIPELGFKGSATRYRTTLQSLVFRLNKLSLYSLVWSE